MEKIRDIPWTRIGAESVAIIVSILLAFWIDAWWAERSETIRTNDLLGSLEAEWIGELGRMDAALSQFSSYRHSMTEVFNFHQQESGLLSEERALELYENHRWSTYKPSTAALDIVLENGLNRIDDSELALAISSWHSVLEEMAPEENALFNLGLGSLREVRQNVAHRLGLPVVSSLDSSPLSWYGPEAGRLIRAIWMDDEVVRVHRQILDIATDYETQLGAARQVLVRNTERLQDYLRNR